MPPSPPSYDQDLLSRLNALKKSSISTLDTSLTSTVLPTSGAERNPADTLSHRLKSLRNNSASSSPSPSTALPTSKTLPSSEASPLLRASESIADQDTKEEDPFHNPALLDTDPEGKSLDQLLAELGGDQGEWDLAPEDPAEVRELLEEARRTLPQHEAATDRSRRRQKDGRKEGIRKLDGKDFLTRDLDMSIFAHGEDEGEDYDDPYEGDGKNEGATGKKGRASGLDGLDQEADEVIRRTLDEVSLDKYNDSELPDEDTEKIEKKEEGSDLSLPSAPSTLPSPPAPTTTAPEANSDEAFSASIRSRMAALSANSLGLPTAPTFKPVDRPVHGLQKKFTDEEVESWCVICQDDATVRCMGCDGDLYCAACWKEGHMGPDVGREERGHSWRKYTKPK